MNIRIAEKNDIYQLVELDKNTSLTSWSEAMYQSSLNNSHNIIFVLEYIKSLEIIACIVVSVVLDEFEILQFWVTDTYKKHGYGEFLLKSVIQEFGPKCGISKIFLEVVESNIPAINLYLKVGFKTISKRKNYYNINGILHDAIVMSYDCE
ncbi:MAG: ribosomal protein S18-alanine N-acetyltransferase [Burkholderiales bacterium]|nr:ribosomal protein S18-alanine N-acetyltransferase [Burkholderiales bacterium]